MNSSGIVKTILGIVKAIAVDGTERILQVGDKVLPNDRIITDESGAISLEFPDGTSMDLGRNSDVTLNEDSLNPDPGVKQGGQSVAEALQEVEAIQQALVEDKDFDPSKLPATAAGALASGGAGGNEGHTFVEVDYLNPNMTPENGFDTTGIGFSFTEPYKDFILNPQQLPMLSVTVDVSVDVKVDLAVETDVDVVGEDVVIVDPETEIGTLPDGSAPNLDVNTVGIIEGTNGDEGKLVNFIISLDQPFNQDVQVTYEIVPGTATGAIVGQQNGQTDYVTENISYTITIPAGQASFIVPVEIVQDHFVEGNESFHIVLKEAVNATIDPENDIATVVIVDDDTPPVANNDSFSAKENTPISITVGDGVLLNDTGAGHGEILTVTSFEQPANGSVELNQDGSFTYTPNEDFFGTDSFNYSMTDGFNGESSATVTIYVDGIPDAVNDVFTGIEGQSISDSVVPNDDPGNVPVVFTNISNPENGTLVFNEDGTFVYTPNEGFTGTDTFTYQITDADGDTDSATVTLNVEALPVLSIGTGIDGGQAVEGNDVTFTVSLDKAASGNTVVEVEILSLLSNTATEGADYESIDTVLVTIPENQLSASFDVSTFVDDLQEGTEDFIARIINVTNSQTDITLGNDTAQGLILDDFDPPVLSIGTGIDGGQAVEGNDVTFTVSLDKVASGNTVVEVEILSLLSNTATEGADYESIDTVLVTIPENQLSASFDVSTFVDDLQEGTEDFTARIINVTNSQTDITLGNDTAQGLILDDFDPPVLSIGTGIDGGQAVEGNDVTFTVSLDKAASGNTVVEVEILSLLSNTATEGADYESIDTVLVTIPENQLSASFDVSTFVDDLQEGTEDFTARIVDVSNSETDINVGNNTALGEILDNFIPPIPPEISIEDAHAVELNPILTDQEVLIGNANSFIEFTVTRTGNTSGVSSVTYTVSPGSAVEGGDYNGDLFDPLTGTITFAAGEAEKVIKLDVTDDFTPELTERFNVELSNPLNATIIDGLAVGTIFDNDTPTVYLDPDGALAVEGNDLVFTVLLTAETLQEVSGDWAVSLDGSAELADLFETAGAIPTGSFSIPAGQQSTSITIGTFDDILLEGGPGTFEDLTLSLSNIVNATPGSVVATGLIEDNDLPDIHLEQDIDGTGALAVEGNDLVFAVTLTAEAQQEVNGDWAVSLDDSAELADLFESAGVIPTGSFSIPVGQQSASIVIGTFDDTLLEGGPGTFEDLTLSLSNIVNANPGDVVATGLIEDNDLPDIHLEQDIDGIGALAVEGNDLVFTVMLTAEAQQEVSGDWAVSLNGSAELADLFETAGAIPTGSFSIPVGQQSASIVIGTFDDTLLEGGPDTFEDLTLSLTNIVNANPGDVVATGLIEDNDYPPLIAATDQDVTVYEKALDLVQDTIDLAPGTVEGSESSLPDETDGDNTLVGAVTGGSGSYTYALVGSSMGTHGQIQVNSDGTYVYTLTLPAETTPHANDGITTLMPETFTYEATDTVTGKTVQGTIEINVVDDIPSFDPPGAEDAVLVTQGTFDLPVTFGADGGVLTLTNEGTVVGTVDGSIENITSNEQPLTWNWESGALVAEQPDGTDVIIITPDAENDQYTVQLLDVLDNATSITTNPFEWSASSGGGGNVDSIALDNGLAQLVFTGSGDGTTVNYSSQGLGVGTGATIDPGDIMTMEIQDAQGNPLAFTDFTFTLNQLSVGETMSWTAYKLDGSTASGTVAGTGQGASSDETFTINSTGGADSELEKDIGGQFYKIDFEYVSGGAQDAYAIANFSGHYQTTSTDSLDVMLNIDAQIVDGDGDIATTDFDVTFTTPDLAQLIVNDDITN